MKKSRTSIYEKRMVLMTINVSAEQQQFLRDHTDNISRFIRKLIEVEMQRGLSAAAPAAPVAPTGKTQTPGRNGRPGAN